MDTGTPAAPPPQASPQQAQGDSTAKIIYILYLVSLAVGVTALVGVVMAYVNVGDAPEPFKTHYRFQIRTFWIGLLYAIVGGILSVVGIGVLLLLLVLVWFIVRCVKGLRYLERRETYPNAETWLW